MKTHSPAINPRYLEMLQHCLGLDRHAQPPANYHASPDDEFPKCYRNRYVTDPAGPDGLLCEEMITQGLMEKPSRQPSFIGNMTNYFATEAGYQFVISHSPPPPKLSRSKQRWQDYRQVADCFGSFRDYLHYIQTK